MCVNDLEGIVAKPLTDAYRPGVRWLKIKNSNYSPSICRRFPVAPAHRVARSVRRMARERRSSRSCAENRLELCDDPNPKRPKAFRFDLADRSAL